MPLVLQLVRKSLCDIILVHRCISADIDRSATGDLFMQSIETIIDIDRIIMIAEFRISQPLFFGSPFFVSSISIATKAIELIMCTTDGAAPIAFSPTHTDRLQMTAFVIER